MACSLISVEDGPSDDLLTGQALFLDKYVEGLLERIVSAYCESHDGMVSQRYQRRAKSVELRGFEPLTPSLRKMWSKPSDQGKRRLEAGLWAGRGARHVRQRELM